MTCENMVILPPYKDSTKFRVDVEPQSKVTVLYGLTSSSYSQQYQMGYGLRPFHIDTKKITQQCLTEGEKKERNLGGAPCGVFLYTFKLEGGYATYYENKAERLYEEDLAYKLENLEIHNGKGTDVAIRVAPGEGQLVILKIIDPIGSVSYASRCSLFLKSHSLSKFEISLRFVHTYTNSNHRLTD